MENKIYPCFLHIPTFKDSFIRAYLKANYLLITKRLLLNRRLNLLYIEKVGGGTFMVVQWLTSPSNAGDTSLIPGQGVKIPHASLSKNQTMKLKQYCSKHNKDLKKKKGQWNTILQSTILQLKGKRKSW